LNNQEVTERQIRGFIQGEIRDGKEPEAVLAADASVPHGRMVALIDLIREAGLTKFAINTDADFKASDLAPPPTEPTEAPAP
jgi:biopolymer transport protein ExbD